MHNIKQIRENFDFYKKKIIDRNIDTNLKTLIDLDKENRTLIQKKEKLEQEKKKSPKLKIKASLKNLKIFLKT